MLIQRSQMWTPHYSIKRTVFLVSLLAGPYAQVPFTQDCPPSLIESTTGHYNSTGTQAFG